MSTNVVMRIKSSFFVLDDEERESSVSLSDEVTCLLEALFVADQDPTFGKDSPFLEVKEVVISVHHSW